jgi:hypothetical protein
MTIKKPLQMKRLFCFVSTTDYFFGSAIAIVFVRFAFLPSAGAASAVPPFWQHEPPALAVPLLQQDFSVATAPVVSHFAPV